MVIVAGAPYYDLAKEREGAPSYLPRCSCPFFIIYPSFSVSVLTLFLPIFYHLSIIFCVCAHLYMVLRNRCK